MSVETETGLAPSTTSQKVFICYRRDETSAHAGRLYDAMVARFGEGNVFMDVELAPGIDFEKRITEVVSGCVALLVVMGRNWATASNEQGRRRLEESDDFVRLELETALGNPDITPIPVLVHGAQMPRREDLPLELRPLARRNAIELSDGRWRYDIGRLLATLDGLLPDGVESGPVVPPPRPEPEPPALGWRLALEGMLIGALSAGITRGLAQAIYDAPEDPERWQAIKAGESVPDNETAAQLREHFIEIISWRVAAFAVLGGALAIWLTRRIWRIYPLRHLLRGLLVGAFAGLLSGAVFAAFAYLPDKTVPLDPRTNIDLLSFALAGGTIGSLIGWLWRPARVGPAILAGAAGGFLGQGIVAIAGWQSTGPLVNTFKFALITAAIVGLALAAMLLADRAEAGET